MRSRTRKDLLFFAIPALFVMSAGMGVSAWDLVRHLERLSKLSVQSVGGLALIVIGRAISLVSAGTLRRSYSSTLTIREDHRLITHGIYRFVRHPIYLGTIMTLVGIPVFASSLYGLLIMSALIPLILYRIMIEERMLTEAFGDAYREYKEATAKLIPFIH